MSNVVIFTAAMMVRASDGSVDVFATETEMSRALSEHIAKYELPDGAVKDAVHALFDKHPGAGLNMPFIIGQVATALGENPGNSKVLREAVHAFMQANADQPAVKRKEKDASGKEVSVEVTPAEAPRTRDFVIGRKNGVRRWSDVPEETA